MVHGWGFKVLWLLDPTATSPVTLRGWNLETGKRIWFIMTDRAASTHPVLDPKMPPVGSASTPAGWGNFPTDVIVPSAGCHVLFAQWTKGSWIVPFAAGR